MHNFVLEATRGEQLIELGLEYLLQDFGGDLAVFALAVLLLVGSGLMLLASVGLIRLPDLPTRMHASTKAGSLGAAMIMLGVAVAIPEPLVLARAFAVISFLLLTAPVAAHVIGRAGYFVGVPLWDGTVKDDLADQYDYERHTLESGGLADRKIEGWDESPKEEDHPYDPLVDDEPPSESIARHPVEEAADDRRIKPTGGEEVTYGDAGAEQAEGQSHETPPPAGEDEEADIGDFAGESPAHPAGTSDDVARAEAEQAVEDEQRDVESNDGDDEDADEDDDDKKKDDAGEMTEPATQ